MLAVFYYTTYFTLIFFILVYSLNITGKMVINGNKKYNLVISTKIHSIIANN